MKELNKYFKYEKKEIKANDRKIKLLSGKPNEVPTIKEFDVVEVIGTFSRNGESAICATIGGLFYPLVLKSANDLIPSNEYDGVLCSEYKTINGFLGWCSRQIG